MSTEAKEVREQQEITAQVFERLRSMGVFKEDGQKVSVPVTGQPKLNVPMPIRGEGTKRNDEKSIRNRNIGEANRKHYMTQATKNGNAWHLNAKQVDQYSEFVIVTPAMAQIVLDKYNPGNRILKRRSLEAYARDIENDRWIETGESIEFDAEGNLYNGQHRFSAVVMANKAALFWVTFNCSVEARYGVDQGVVRSATEKISLVMENKIGDKLPAVARSMMRGLSKLGMKFSNVEITDFALKYGPMIEWATRQCKGCRADVQAAVAKAALWYGIDAVEPFTKQLTNLHFDGVDDPAKRLFEFLHRGRTHGGSTNGLITYKKTLAAIEAFLQGRKIRALYEKEEDLFEWVGKWEMPKKAKG
jgi:hypothetical protein